MSYEMKPGQGSIFKNDKKTEEKHPDYKGSIMTPDGKECWISMWVKRPEGKTPFFSVSVQPKEQQTASAPAQLPEEPKNDLPF